MFGAIKQDIKEIKEKQEHIIWLMKEVMKYGKKMNSHNQSVVITKPEASNNAERYNKKLLDIIDNRFKRLDHIAKAMKCTEQTVITYIKLARKAGHSIETRSVKGQRPSYKLKKETL